MQAVKTMAQYIADLIENAISDEQRATVIAAEEIVIGYYFDMESIMPGILSTGFLPKTMPSQDPIRKAITELNRACAEQHKDYIFDGRIDRLKDRFQFAADVASAGA